MKSNNQAPGHPGISPTWSSSSKDMVATALGASRIWATYGFGVVNEVYWPSTGLPQIRDLGFIVAGPNGWTEVKRVDRYTVTTPNPHVPLVKIVHQGDDYRLEVEFLPHPQRDVLLIRYALEGDGLTLYALLAPHLNGERRNNTALAGADLAAEHGAAALSLHADEGFSRTSAGFVGVSDGWQDFHENGAMNWTFERAEDGNVALTGELAARSGTLALGFAQTLEGARTLARSSLADDYEQVRELFIDQWESWGATLSIPYTTQEFKRQAELSAMVLKVHEDRTYAGAMVASLSVPWGSAHDDPGGYHLVWTRDTVEAAFALITVGQLDDAARTLAYLIGTQAEDGSWAQNYFPDGRGYWSGRQLDEVALPILLAAKLRAVGRLADFESVEEMITRAVGFVVRNGPMSDQDRWEENAGASPYTLAVTIAALVAVADLFDGPRRDYVLSLADCWNERIEEFCYAPHGPLASKVGAVGYYVRIGPRAEEGGMAGMVPVKNVADGTTPANELVGMEFLYLCRMGLRDAHDPRISDTLRLAEHMLKADTPSGPSFHRYNGDGYGEHEDGKPFDGTGIGRLWPLLTGERGHHAVALGDDATSYLQTMIEMTGPGGLIPEQVWDADPIPERYLYPGRPSGSAMPLVWAHGEFLKLLAAKTDGRPSERLEAVEARYGGKRPKAGQWHWRRNSPFTVCPTGRDLLIEGAEPFVLHFGRDGWDSVEERTAEPTAFGLYGVRLRAEELKEVSRLVFTFRYPEREAWEGRNYQVTFGEIVG